MRWLIAAVLATLALAIVRLLGVVTWSWWFVPAPLGLWGTIIFIALVWTLAKVLWLRLQR